MLMEITELIRNKKKEDYEHEVAQIINIQFDECRFCRLLSRQTGKLSFVQSGPTFTTQKRQIRAVISRVLRFSLLTFFRFQFRLLACTRFG